MLLKLAVCFAAGIGAGLGTGAAGHFAIGGLPDLWCLLFCVASTFLWARIAARFANKADAATLNRVTGGRPRGTRERNSWI